jgi:hypothetical protein
MAAQMTIRARFSLPPRLSFLRTPSHPEESGPSPYSEPQNTKGPVWDGALENGMLARQATEALIQSSSFFFCTMAPVCCAVTWPFLNMISVGMARMPYLPVTVGF